MDHLNHFSTVEHLDDSAAEASPAPQVQPKSNSGIAAKAAHVRAQRAAPQTVGKQSRAARRYANVARSAPPVQRKRDPAADAARSHSSADINRLTAFALRPDLAPVQHGRALTTDSDSPQVLQRKLGRDPGAHSADVSSAAAAGIDTPATSMPFASQIQASFGGHDVSGIRAHTNSQAGAAAAAM